MMFALQPAGRLRGGHAAALGASTASGWRMLGSVSGAARSMNASAASSTAGCRRSRSSTPSGDAHVGAAARWPVIGSPDGSAVLTAESHAARRHHQLRLRQPALGRQGLRAGGARERGRRPHRGQRRSRATWPPPIASCCRASAPSPTAGPASTRCPACAKRSRRPCAKKGRPFLGICVGMQLMAERGARVPHHAGLRLDQGRRAGASSRAIPRSRSRTWAGTRWTSVNPHPLLAGIPTGPDGLHAYFVHSFHLRAGGSRGRWWRRRITVDR